MIEARAKQIMRVQLRKSCRIPVAIEFISTGDWNVDLSIIEEIKNAHKQIMENDENGA